MCEPVSMSLAIGALTGAGGVGMGMGTGAAVFAGATTALSTAGTLMGQQAQKKMINQQNEAQRIRYRQQTAYSNQALMLDYEQTTTRMMQENRAYSESRLANQREYDSALAQVRTTSAEAGVTGLNLDAIQQSIDMEMGRGSTSLSTNLAWRNRQFQIGLRGDRAGAINQILSTTPRYEAPPGMTGALLTSAGAGMGNLAAVGGDKFFAGIPSSPFGKKVGGLFKPKKV